MAGMTAVQKEKFQELLGYVAGDPLLWDSLPMTVKRILVYGSGVQQHRVFTEWGSVPEADREKLTRAAASLADWAEFTRQRMAQKPEEVAA